MASLIRELARRRRKREQERQLGHAVPAGHHHELDEPGIDADMLVPLQDQQHTYVSGLFPFFGRWQLVPTFWSHHNNDGLKAVRVHQKRKGST